MMASASTEWRFANAPSLADFEALAQDAWNNLPSEFRTLAGDVVIRIEDFAPDELLDELEIEDAYDLTGIYQGVSLDRQSVSDAPREPNMVFLYRRAILDEWAAGEEELGHLIAHVLIHEIGHHFGLSDEDMEAAETEATA
jgi:predicted Zn-dependent protease with MMP-like domain